MRQSGRRPVPARPPRDTDSIERSDHTPRAPKHPEVTLGSGETVAMATFDDRRRGRLTEATYVFVILILPAFAVGSLIALLQFHPAADKGALNKALWLYLICLLAALLAVSVYEARSTSTGQPRWRDARAGTRVVRLRDGQPPGFVASLGRAILPVIAGMVGFVVGSWIPWVAPLDLVLGPGLWALVYATAFWDDHGRGWHDKLAGTVVIADTSRRMDWWSKQAPEDPCDSAD